MKESGVNLTLTVVDTPGFGDAVDNSGCWDPVTQYVEAQYEAKIANLKEQSQYFLAQQKAELEKFTRSYTDYKAHKESEVSGLNAELQLLYEFARKSSLIVEKMESGHYRMRERSGLKAVVVPAKDRPEPLNMERMKHLHRMEYP